MKYIGVFCSASDLSEKYTVPAREFARKMAESGYHLVWGGSDTGLMKIIASGFFIPETVPDGSRAYVFNIAGFDLVAGNRFQDGGIRGDGVSVEIRNATGKPLIASSFAMMLERLGANVVQKSTDTVIQQEKCRLSSENDVGTDRPIISYLIRSYGCELVNRNTRDGEEDASADILVVLGEEFVK